LSASGLLAVAPQRGDFGLISAKIIAPAAPPDGVALDFFFKRLVVSSYGANARIAEAVA
jgi:hypothetical protein